MPAAIAAKIAAPERFNNGMYGTIRMHQEREFPGREHGTRLVNSDFAQFARAYGAFGVAVETTEEFAAALTQALLFMRERHLPALIEPRMDPEVITPNATLSAIRATARPKS